MTGVENGVADFVSRAQLGAGLESGCVIGIGVCPDSTVSFSDCDSACFWRGHDLGSGCEAWEEL